MAIVTMTKQVISYCDIPEELTEDHHISEYQPDCYVNYRILPDEPENEDPLDAWIRKTYPKLIGVSFLIEMDY